MVTRGLDRGILPGRIFKGVAGGASEEESINKT